MHAQADTTPGTISFSDLNELKYHHYGKARAIYLGRFDQPPDPLLPHPDPEDQLKGLHGRYLSYAASRRIVLHRELEDGNEYRSHGYVVRGAPEYTRKMKSRVWQIGDTWQRLRLPKGTAIRVSTRQVGSIWQHYLGMKKDWTRFMNWLRMEYAGTIYVWTTEPTKRGYCHYHIVCARLYQGGPLAQRILQWWQRRGHDIEDGGVEVKPVRREAISYVLKYQSKQCHNRLWNAILWLSGRRSLGVSRALSGLAGPHQGPEQTNSQSWTLLGVLPAALVEWIEHDRPPPEDIIDMMRALDPRTVSSDGLGSRAKRFISAS